MFKGEHLYHGRCMDLKKLTHYRRSVRVNGQRDGKERQRENLLYSRGRSHNGADKNIHQYLENVSHEQSHWKTGKEGGGGKSGRENDNTDTPEKT